MPLSFAAMLRSLVGISTTIVVSGRHRTGFSSHRCFEHWYHPRLPPSSSRRAGRHAPRPIRSAGRSVKDGQLEGDPLRGLAVFLDPSRRHRISPVAPSPTLREMTSFDLWAAWTTSPISNRLPGSHPPNRSGTTRSRRIFRLVGEGSRHVGRSARRTYQAVVIGFGPAIRSTRNSSSGTTPCSYWMPGSRNVGRIAVFLLISERERRQNLRPVEPEACFSSEWESSRLWQWPSATRN